MGYTATWIAVQSGAKVACVIQHTVPYRVDRLLRSRQKSTGFVVAACSCKRRSVGCCTPGIPPKHFGCNMKNCNIKNCKCPSSRLTKPKHEEGRKQQGPSPHGPPQRLQTSQLAYRTRNPARLPSDQPWHSSAPGQASGTSGKSFGSLKPLRTQPAAVPARTAPCRPAPRQRHRFRRLRKLQQPRRRGQWRRCPLQQGHRRRRLQPAARCRRASAGCTKTRRRG